MSTEIVPNRGGGKLGRARPVDEDRRRAFTMATVAFLEGCGPNTRRTYRAAVKQFFGLFPGISPDDVTVTHAVAFKRFLQDHSKADATIYHRIAALSSLFKYYCRPQGTTDVGLITSNPFELVQRADVKPTPYGRARPVAWDDFVKILQAIPMTPLGMRDKAILVFFAFTGRRRTEVSSLRIRDLNLKATPRTYTVRAKGNKVQTYELPDVVYDAMRAYWIASQRLALLRPESGVFTPTVDCPITATLDPERPLTERTMNKILRRWADVAGVDEVHVHGIRHMAAHDLDKGGVRLQDIQAFLGHASPQTTMVYLARLGQVGPSHEAILQKVRHDVAKVVRGV